MLNDHEISLLKKCTEYTDIKKRRYKEALGDLLNSCDGELYIDFGFFKKCCFNFLGKQILKKELFLCSEQLIFNLINYELEWKREPEQIENICDSNRNGHQWMKYREPQVKALFSFTLKLLNDSEYRNLLKRRSSLLDPNKRLNELIHELESLEKKTIDSILAGGLIEICYNTFYKTHKDELSKKILHSSTKGNLGVIDDVQKELNDEDQEGQIDEEQGGQNEK